MYVQNCTESIPYKTKKMRCFMVSLLVAEACRLLDLRMSLICYVLNADSDRCADALVVTAD